MGVNLQAHFVNDARSTFWGLVTSASSNFNLGPLNLRSVSFSHHMCRLGRQLRNSNASVKVNLDLPPTPGHLGLYLHINSSLSPQCVRDSRVLSFLSRGMLDIN